jgi:predicted N-acyltransferase
MQIDVRAHPSIRAIPEETWDSLEGVSDAPFLSWAFLDTLERTGCVGDEAGWIPHPITFHLDDALVAAAPAYLKTNSDGEFVFDHGWAGASERSGIPYYPKLVVAAPFTPATGARLLVAKGIDRTALAPALAEALRAICKAEKISGAHVLFPTEAEAVALGEAGMIHRYGLQFQWRNAGYSTFDDFLARFSSKRRNQIKRERREMETAGIKIETFRDEIPPKVLGAMYSFYESTVEKFTWGRHYLNRAFFEEISVRLRGKIEIVMATKNGRPVGGAFNLAGPKALFGRYWGCQKDIPFLHFNVCFYHTIDECIQRKIELFEPGAGGRHKLARGFEPTITHSAHHLVHPGLRRAVLDFVESEREVQTENAGQKALAWR